jgi:hypothetical protein
MATWQRGPLGLREREIQAGVVVGDQAAQPGTLLRRATGNLQVGAGTMQRQGQVVDAGPFPA